MQSFFDFGMNLGDDIESRRAETVAGNNSRLWCDPRRHTEIVGADVGCGYVHMHSLRRGIDHDKIHVSRFIESIPCLPKGALLVVEDAHIGVPQTSRSLAQPWTAEELQSINRSCDQCSVTIRMFPHAHTTKVRLWVAEHGPPGFVDAEKSSDINDARALSFFVEHNNSLSLLRPRVFFGRSPIREYGRAVRKYSNHVLNASRAIGYGSGKFRHIESVASRISSVGNYGVRFIDNEMTSISIASLVCHEIDDEPVRFVYRGLPLGAKSWMRHVLMMSPCHHRGGVARSNCMNHRYRSFLRKLDGPGAETLKIGTKLIPFPRHTAAQDSERRARTKIMRLEIREAYREAVALSSGFRPFEVLDAVEAT